MTYFRICRSTGITLLELMIVLAVIGIAATIATPSLQSLIRENRVTAQNNELVALIAFAKSQAIRRNEDWQLELLSDADGPAWSGHVRLRDEKDIDQELNEGCPNIDGIVRCSDFQGVVLKNATVMTFNNRGYLEQPSGAFDSISLTLIHQPCSGERQAREITILATGQISSKSVPCK